MARRPCSAERNPGAAPRRSVRDEEEGPEGDPLRPGSLRLPLRDPEGPIRGPEGRSGQAGQGRMGMLPHPGPQPGAAVPRGGGEAGGRAGGRPAGSPLRGPCGAAAAQHRIIRHVRPGTNMARGIIHGGRSPGHQDPNLKRCSAGEDGFPAAQVDITRCRLVPSLAAGGRGSITSVLLPPSVACARRLCSKEKERPFALRETSSADQPADEERIGASAMALVTVYVGVLNHRRTPCESRSDAAGPGGCPILT